MPGCIIHWLLQDHLYVLAEQKPARGRPGHPATALLRGSWIITLPYTYLWPYDNNPHSLTHSFTPFLLPTRSLWAQVQLMLNSCLAGHGKACRKPDDGCMFPWGVPSFLPPSFWATSYRCNSLEYGLKRLIKIILV